MTTQVQIRGASSGTQNVRTLTSRELDVDTTNKRLSVHDGATLGGIKHANVFDIQNNPWTTAQTSGTNTYAAALAVTLLGYAAYQRFSIKMGITNTGASTLNVDGNGAKTIKKRDNSGALTDVVAGDLVLGNIYEVMYDGTYMQLLGAVGGGSTITEISSATASSSTSIDFTGLNSTYDYYYVDVENWLYNGTTSQFLRAQLSQGAGIVTADSYIFQGFQETNGAATSYPPTQNGFAYGPSNGWNGIIIWDNSSSGLTTYVNGRVWIYHKAPGGRRYIRWDFHQSRNISGNSNPCAFRGIGELNANADIDGIRFTGTDLFHATIVLGGKFTLYGVA